MRIASAKIKKYHCQKYRGLVKKANKKAADWFRNAGYSNNDDLKTIDYNNNASINDLENTIIDHFNNIDLKQTSRKRKGTTYTDNDISPKRIKVNTSYTRNKNAQVSTKKILQKQKYITKKSSSSFQYK